MNMDEMVTSFHKRYDHPISQTPVDYEYLKIRGKWIKEEVDEFIDAVDERDFFNILKELADILFFVVGTFVTLGVKSLPIFRAVYLSNMTKPRGVKDEFGKTLKTGGEYVRPDIAGAVEPL